MIQEIDRIPNEIYTEAEKFGVLKDEIEIAAYSDKNKDCVFCDNWILVTKDEILQIGGINLVLPKRNVKRFDSNKLTVKFDKISIDRLNRLSLSDFKVEKQLSGCIVTALNNETDSYVLITYSTATKEKELIKLCDSLNQKETDDENGRHRSEKHGSAPADRRFPPHGFDRGPKDEEFCPKCGRKYPGDSKICPHCVSKFAVVKCLWGFVKKYKFSVGLIFLTMALMTGLSVLSPYVSSQFFYDEVLTKNGRFYGQILLVIGIIVSLKILTLLIQMICDVITARVVPKITYDLKNTIFQSIEKLSLSFFTNRRTGSLMNQVNGDANTIYWFFVEGLPYFIINLAQTIGVAAIMLVMDWRLTLVALVFCPLGFLAIGKLSANMRKLSARSYSASRAMNGHLSDVLGAVRVVKAFAGERNEVKTFDKKSEDLATADKNAGMFANAVFPSVVFMFVISGILVTAVGGWFVIMGDITYGKLLAFIAYSSMLQSPLFFFVNIVQQIAGCFNATYRLMEVMDADPEVLESQNPITLDVVRGDIEFKNVSFGYDKTRKVIEDINFKIDAGKKVGIVGHTGAGKSTIANLLIRLYDTDTGEILIDGHNVRDISFESLRNNIAIVSQETYLFQGTILENIKYAKPDATYEEVIVASKISGAHDFIIKLPDGYSTNLGMGNRQLSGGERQRISIARAILRDPKILILDEATSAMDTRTERSIQTALEKLCKGRTTIMIAHRLSTLRDCEDLLVIENGKLAEHGNHLELIRQKGIYFKLYSLQYEALKDAGVEE